MAQNLGSTKFSPVSAESYTSEEDSLLKRLRLMNLNSRQIRLRCTLGLSCQEFLGDIRYMSTPVSGFALWARGACD